MIYKAYGYDDSSIHYMGNGKMLVCANGTELLSIHGRAYSTPCIGALSICDNIESETVRLKNSLCYKHRVYIEPRKLNETEIKNIGFAHMDLLDYMDPEKEIFIRNSNSCCEYSMRLSTPSYVRKYKFEGYKLDRRECVYAYIIPAGTCYFENFYCPDEVRMLIIAKGNIEFDGEYFNVYEGNSQIIITTGDPAQALENARYAVKHWQNELDENPIYTNSVSYWNRLTENCASEKIEDALISLLARQSVDGGIMASYAFPMSDARAFESIVKAFLALSLTEPCERLIGYYRKKLEESRSKGVHTHYGICSDDVLLDINQGVSAAELLNGFVYYFSQNNLSSNDVQMMKDLFYIAENSVISGMVPFNGREPELERGIIPKESVFQGSLAASAEVLTACRKFLTFANEKHIRLRDNASGINAKLQNAEDTLCGSFIFEERFVANSLKLEGCTSRKRFIYSRCGVCEKQGRFALLTWLERDKFGRYLCPSCMMRKDIVDDYSVDRVFVLAHLCKAMLAGLVENKYEDRALEEIRARVQIYISSSGDLPMRSGAEDILVSDVMAKYGIDNDEYNEKLDDIADSVGTISAYYIADRRVGSEGDSYPTSLYLCNLINRRRG